jgi:hypothetical protein
LKDAVGVPAVSFFALKAVNTNYRLQIATKWRGSGAVGYERIVNKV